MAVKYWARGSNDKKMSDTIYLAFTLLGYKCGGDLLGISFAAFDSSNTLYYTLDDDKKVYHAYEGDSEFRVVTKLIELDDSFVELKPETIIIIPKYDVNDVIYEKDKMYHRAFIISVNKSKQTYTVKDHKAYQYEIPFEEQDNWALVLTPKFKEDDMITDGDTKLFVIEVDYRYMRYKVNVDGDFDYFTYIEFREQDGWELIS